MTYQNQFYEACENGHLNVVQYLLEHNYNINVRANNEEGFRRACGFGNLNIVQYLLTKTNITNEMLKIMCKYKYKFEHLDEIKSHVNKEKYSIVTYDNKLQSFKILFTLCNIINIDNAIYFGII